MEQTPNIPNLLANVKMSAPEVPVAPALPVGVPVLAVAAPAVMNLFGQEFQKKHVYAFGFVVVLVLAYLFWRWYSKSSDDDEDEDDEEMEEGYPQYMPQHQYRMMPPGYPGMGPGMGYPPMPQMPQMPPMGHPGYQNTGPTEVTQPNENEQQFEEPDTAAVQEL